MPRAAEGGDPLAQASEEAFAACDRNQGYLTWSEAPRPFSDGQPSNGR